jgi:thiol-disulfide isomerase/thioredoxin
MSSDDATLAGPPPPSDRPSSRRRWLEALGLILGLTALLVVAALWSQPAPRGDAGSAAGSFDVARLAPAPAPDFELAGLDGKPVRLADFRGRVIFLNFWATWCPPCREEMPAMQALARELEKDGLVVLAVNYEESAETAEAFVRETGLTLPVVLDGEGAVARRYRVTGLPASFFVDRRGALVGSVLGIRDWQGAAARRYIEGLLRPAG